MKKSIMVIILLKWILVTNAADDETSSLLPKLPDLPNINAESDKNKQPVASLTPQPDSPPDKTSSSSYGTIYDPAFQNFVKKQFPMTPQQIKALHEIYLKIKRAGVAEVESPTPMVSTRHVPLSPGSVPPVIKMATGYVSSIVFLDETGQPWPIANYSLGNPTAFNIQWDSSSNVLMIQGTTHYDVGNIAIRLAGLDTPVMLTMVNDQQNVDYRVDMRVQGRGPNAKSSMLGASLPTNANVALTDLLDGIPPLGSTKLKISGGPAQAWLLGTNLYLRTNITILSPSWNATMESADGMRVYEMNVTPMILASNNGNTLQLKVEGL